MITLQSGAVKFKSIKQAYEAARKAQPNLSYITFYMRVRYSARKSVQKAKATQVRKYERKVALWDIILILKI